MVKSTYDRGKLVDVVVSGADSNGLMIACELALCGVQPIVPDCFANPGNRVQSQ